MFGHVAADVAVYPIATTFVRDKKDEERAKVKGR